jgi:hypothetical protein
MERLTGVNDAVMILVFVPGDACLAPDQGYLAISPLAASTSHHLTLGSDHFEGNRRARQGPEGGSPTAAKRRAGASLRWTTKIHRRTDALQEEVHTGSLIQAKLKKSP